MKRELVPIEERRWIAENAVIEMGTVVKYKVMDVDKVVKRMKDQRESRGLTDFVNIIPISPDMYKVPNKFITFQKDPITGVYYGLAIDQDQFGNIRWQKIQMGDSMPLDLTRLNDSRIWAVLRFSSDIEGSPFQSDTPYYKVYDPVEVAKAERAEIDLMKEAFDRINSIQENPKEMVLFSRYLGEDVKDTDNYDVVYGILLKHAKNYPAIFKKRWESKARSYAEKFYTAKALGIVTSDADRGFLFRGISLGISEEDSIRTIIKDKNLLASISNEIEEKDIVVMNITKGMKEKEKPEHKEE